jgi:hypothetical protein
MKSTNRTVEVARVVTGVAALIVILIIIVTIAALVLHM